MKKKIILPIIFLIYLIFAICNSRYDSIEEKIIDDTNTGVSINADTTVDLYVVDEPFEEFYVCVGETTSDHICVLSIQYTSSGFSYANKQNISRKELFNEDRRTLTVNKQKIVYGFTDNTENKILEVDGRKAEVFSFENVIDTKKSEVGFWYYFE